MASSKRLKSSTLLPSIAEHRQAKVCDCSVLEGAGASLSCSNCSRSSRGRQLKEMLRPLVRLKDAVVELIVSESTPRGCSSAVYYYSMGMVIGPVDFGGYGAVTASRKYNSGAYSYRSSSGQFSE